MHEEHTVSAQEITLDRIRESGRNPRRTFGESQLRELADNILVHGVLQPIVLRPAPDGADGMYELVAGARRLRASKLAGKNTIPGNCAKLDGCGSERSSIGGEPPARKYPRAG